MKHITALMGSPWRGHGLRTLKDEALGESVLGDGSPWLISHPNTSWKRICRLTDPSFCCAVRDRIHLPIHRQFIHTLFRHLLVVFLIQVFCLALQLRSCWRTRLESNALQDNVEAYVLRVGMRRVAARCAEISDYVRSRGGQDVH